MREDWDAFWQGHGRDGALTEAPVDAPEIAKGWREFFAAQKSCAETPRLLDLACGAGEVALLGREVLGAAAQITCLDYSPAAVAKLAEDSRINDAREGDAAALPFAGACFDVVVSQFGIEYAGLGAFSEAARVVAPGGELRVVAHLEGGAIWQECRTNESVVRGILESGVFEAALGVFGALAEVRQGQAGEVELKAAMSKVASAVPALQTTLAGAPAEAAARQFGERLYADFSRIFSRLTAFEPTELSAWATAMKAETEAYAARMAAMTGAALTADEAAKAVDLIGAAGLVSMPLEKVTDRNSDVAWVLRARRD